MRVAYLAAGAAGMLCGSCIRDNRVVASLRAQGRDVILVPLYTPLRSDEPVATTTPIYYGGLNVYLQQVSGLFRWLPRRFDRILDAPGLLSGIGKLATSNRPESLGDLTLSVLRGRDGRQRKELDRLVDMLSALRPDLISLPNLMFLGVARELHQRLGVPLVCTLSGEDLFLDALPPRYRDEAFALIAEHAAACAGFIAVTRYYADHAIAHFRLPRERIAVVPLGLELADFPAATPVAPFTIGYLARQCPEKGLDLVIDTFASFHQAGTPARLLIAGYQPPAEQPFIQSLRDRLASLNLTRHVEWRGEITRADKLALLRRMHVLSVPTRYPEAKGLYVLEALAAGVPVVQPDHGSFPEIIHATGGGRLHPPHDTAALAEHWRQLHADEPLRQQLAAAGRAAIHARHDAADMARRTWDVFVTLATGRSLPDLSPTGAASHASA